MIYTADQVKPEALALHLDRARSAIGHGILYELGAGGMNPAALLPSDATGKCDCSGFALAWVAGISREQEGKGKPWSSSIPWVSTDSVHADATGEQQLYVRLERPVPGCMCVYPASGNTCGHCCVVTAVQADLDGNTTKLVGIDCHGGVGGHTVSAIFEYDVSYFLSKNHVYVVLKEELK